MNTQLRISLLEELVALERRALAWAQFGHDASSTDARIRAIRTTLDSMPLT